MSCKISRSGKKNITCIQAFFGLVVGFWFFPSQRECLHPHCLPWEKGFLQCCQHHGNSQVLPPSLNTLESMTCASRSCGHTQVDSLVWQSLCDLSSAAATVPEHREWHSSLPGEHSSGCPNRKGFSCGSQFVRVSTECAVFTFPSFLVSEKPNQNTLHPPRNVAESQSVMGRFGFLAQIKRF